MYRTLTKLNKWLIIVAMITNFIGAINIGFLYGEYTRMGAFVGKITTILFLLLLLEFSSEGVVENDKRAGRRKD